MSSTGLFATGEEHHSTLAKSLRSAGAGPDRSPDVSSWGTWWGDGGWAKIIRGTNNLGIELQDVYWALPDARDFP